MPIVRAALVHDYLLVMRGAERTFATMASCWPDAPIHTLLYDEQATGGWFSGRQVRTSGLQRLGVRQGGFRRLLPAYPLAIERMRIEDAQVVVSSSSAFAHGIRPPDGATHVCYCHTPFRYVWHERERGLSEAPALLRPALAAVLDRMAEWDLRAAARVDHYIANSQITRSRVRELYGRDAPVIHPPVDVARFAPDAPEDWFLFVGEIVRHKRIEVVLDAARRSGQRVKVVGTGPERDRLSALYHDTAEFLGRVTDAELANLYARARAVVVPNVEEFGIVAVEAQAAGRPVVALDAGGTRETVIDGETGILVSRADVALFADAMADGAFDRFDSRALVQHASQFGPDAFRRKLLAEVSRVTEATGA